MIELKNVVKVYNAMDEERDKFDKINDDLYKSNRKSQFLSDSCFYCFIDIFF